MELGSKKYDVIVIGAGHAGCEAALACARLGHPTLLLTINIDSVARMSCNPAIGGLAKGHLVKEIDALGGEMARNTDETGIQFRQLNTKKGPAVRSSRAQGDRQLYHLRMKKVLERQDNIFLKQAIVDEILVEDGKAVGVETNVGEKFRGRAVIVTTGTFLRGLVHIGLKNFPAGRLAEDSRRRVTLPSERPSCPAFLLKACRVPSGFWSREMRVKEGKSINNPKAKAGKPLIETKADDVVENCLYDHIGDRITKRKLSILT